MLSKFENSKKVVRLQGTIIQVDFKVYSLVYKIDNSIKYKIQKDENSSHIGYKQDAIKNKFLYFKVKKMLGFPIPLKDEGEKACITSDTLSVLSYPSSYKMSCDVISNNMAF